jgi:hypothetical protein
MPNVSNFRRLHYGNGRLHYGNGRTETLRRPETAWGLNAPILIRIKIRIEQ